MKPRDRVLTALKRTGIPDRVPLQFDLCRQLTDAFGAQRNIPVHYTTSYFEDVTYRISANELRTAMGSDCVVVGGSLPRGYQHPTTADGCIVNEFGMTMRQGPLYMEVVDTPLRNVSSVAQVEAHPMPDPLAAGRFDDAEKCIQQYKEDYFIIGDLELTMFEMSWHMVGLEKFMMDMATGEEYVEVLLDRVKTFSIGVGKRLAELGVDGIWFGDDFGAQNGMMISPRMWRRIFKPRYAELFQEFKAANPDLLIISAMSHLLKTSSCDDMDRMTHLAKRQPKRAIGVFRSMKSDIWASSCTSFLIGFAGRCAPRPATQANTGIIM